MPTPTLAMHDEYVPLSAGLAEPAIETGTLVYRLEHDAETFEVFEVPDEPFIGRYTTADDEAAYYRITPAEEIADAAVIWMAAGFSLVAFDGDAGKQLLYEFSRSTAHRPSE
jgi:hypothetical protein